MVCRAVGRGAQEMGIGAHREDLCQTSRIDDYMAESWDFIETAQVGSKKKITLPERLRDEVTIPSQLAQMGKRVYWNLLPENGIIIVSNARLEGDDYLPVKETDLQKGNTIRPPNPVVNGLERPIYEGLKVVYLAHDEMLQGDVRSVYLLTESQAFRLVGDPRDAGSETDDPGDSSLFEKLSNTPAFLPNVE